MSAKFGVDGLEKVGEIEPPIEGDVLFFDVFLRCGINLVGLSCHTQRNLAP
jgi:hypothetical protein